ncbi:MAG: hypothetical protein EAZ99_11155 [Alphaproteobacteria bacterium]|nr:MAG: hypothetical protein EAZ99_11155 [Alphaproteobacteria bacterium]
MNDTRFDDRILKTGKDGADFEQFVVEFLNREANSRGHVRGLAAGQDGGVDIYNQDAPIREIIECKFIGKNVTDNALSRWRAIKGKLTDNLIAVARGKRSKKYRVWLKGPTVITKYGFYTSDICPDASTRSELYNDIRITFHDVSTMHDSLSHLAEIDIDVRFWDDFAASRAEHPALFFRWFGGLGYRYKLLNSFFTNNNRNFRQYLTEGALRYFGRDEFELETGNRNTSHFQTAVDFLTQDGVTRTLVIDGPGGVGKTRLSVELCRAAEKKGWTTLCLEHSAKPERLREICGESSGPLKLILFFDYPEQVKSFDELVDIITELSSEGQHSISLVAATRSSAVTRVIGGLERLSPQRLSQISSRAGPTTPGYERWVVAQILADAGIPQAAQIEQSCGNLPVIAAFAAFLYKRDHNQFKQQFASLRAVGDFRRWIDSRLRNLETRLAVAMPKQELASFVCQLPMTVDEANEYYQTNGNNSKIIDFLKQDLWIFQEPDGSVAISHDIFADEILAAYLFENSQPDQFRLNHLLTTALTGSYLDRCLTAVDRLASRSSQNPDLSAQEPFAHLSGKQAVDTLLRSNREATIQQIAPLVRSQLVTPSDLLQLIDAHPDVGQAVASDPDAHRALARAADWARKQPQDIQQKAQKVLEQPLTIAVNHPRRGSWLLNPAYLLHPAAFRNRVWARLNGERDATEQQYLLEAVIRAGEPSDQVLSPLISWLQSHSKSLSAQFLYKAWLYATRDGSSVRSAVLEWLSAHRTALEASFVLASWLNATRDGSSVRSAVLEWLSAHPTALETGSVLSRWLDATQDGSSVRSAVLDWLSAQPTALEARFVLASWLDATQDGSSVRSAVLEWLSAQPTALEARFVLSRWLDATQDGSSVQSVVLEWLLAHPTALETESVLASWLDATQDGSSVRFAVLEWLSAYPTALETESVLASWLAATQDVQSVRGSVHTWLSKCGTTPEAWSVYTAWLEARGDLREIQSAVLGWLAEHATLPDAAYLYGHWLSARGPVQPIRGFLIAWLERHADRKEADIIFRSWRSANHDPAVMAPYEERRQRSAP